MTFELELVNEMIRWEPGNEFQLYGADQLKVREQVEWVLLRWRCQGGTCMFDESCLMILLLC